MDLVAINQVISYVNVGLETLSVIFITFVFFDLIFVDRTIKLTGISEKFEKFHRYDTFKSSLVFLVLNLYFFFFAKISLLLKFPDISFTIFTLMGNVFLLLFTFKLYNLIHKYVSKEK